MSAQEVAQSVPALCGDLYVMQAGRDGPIKIGYSKNVRSRQVTMQANCPYPIDVLLTVRDGAHLERIWHKAFGGRKLRGEWFDWTPEVAEAIRMARSGQEWWTVLFPDDDRLCAATANLLDDDKSEEFEEAYWDCVGNFRFEIEDALEMAGGFGSLTP